MKKYGVIGWVVCCLAGCSASNGEPALPLAEEPNPSTLDLSAYEVKEDQLFVENGPGLSYFQTEPFLSLGTPVEVDVTEHRFDGTPATPLTAKVTLLNADVVEDAEGSGRLGVRFVFEEENVNDTAIEVGDPFSAPHAATQLAVFYGETHLKVHPDVLVETLETQHYVENQRVVVSENDGGVKCSSGQTLEAGGRRLCYEVVSFAGSGEYLVNIAMDFTQNVYGTYEVTIPSTTSAND